MSFVVKNSPSCERLYAKHNRKEQIREEIHRFQQYVQKHRWKLLISNILFLFVWSLWIFDIAPRIDTEVMINNPGTSYNWLNIGRQGAVLTSILAGIKWYNPFFAVVAGYFLICLAGIIFGYVLWRASGKDSLVYPLFSLICFATPIMAEQFYFELQILEIGWAYLLCGLAVAATLFGVIRKDRLMTLLSVACLVWSYSTYQIFVVIYITLILTCFLILYQKWTIDEKAEDAPILHLVLESLVVVAATVVLNSVITKLVQHFAGGSTYLTSQILWLSQPASVCLNNVKDHLYQGFFGKNVFYSPFYWLFALMSVPVAICRLVTSPQKKYGYFYLLAVCGLQLCPFLLTIAMGVIPSPRAQLAYSLVMACNMIFLLIQPQKHRFTKYLLVLVCTVAVCGQVNCTMRMVYTDEVRAEEDNRLATEIEMRVVDVSSLDKPIAFVGVYTPHLNASCMTGEMIGHSAFNMGAEVEPHYYFSAARGYDDQRILGFRFKVAKPEQFLEARRQALRMPVWPDKGSVVDAGDYTIVKLSEDSWPEEVLDTEIEVVEEPEMIHDLRVAVDSTQLVDGELVLKGWLLKDGISSNSIMPEVVLRSRTTGSCYSISTARVDRLDVAEAFDNEMYRNAGYNAKVSVEILAEPLNHYDLLIGFEQLSNGKRYALDTGYQWPEEFVR